MKSFLAYAFVFLAGLVGVSLNAQAQATRTWVSGVGDDANPCSRTAPCKTWPGAISKTAPNGEINALDPGGFGAVTITKAITIDGGGGIIASTLVSGTNAIIVNAGVNDTVILRNIQINGLGTGLSAVKFLGGKQLIVDHVQIFGFTNGIEVSLAAAGDLVVRDTTITNTLQSAVTLTTSSGNLHASLSNVALRFMTNGVVTNSSSATADVSDSTIVGASANGAHAILGAISIADSMFARNTAGVLSEVSGTIRLNNVTFYDNPTGIACGGNVVTAGNNHLSKLGTGCAPTAQMIVQ